MKRFLLDTHVFVWLVEDPSQIPMAILDELADQDNEVFVSAATFWEIAMNRNRGRMQFHGSVADELRGAGFTELAVSGIHYEISVSLPPFHKDPFDRLLVAQAMKEGLILITRDKLLANYTIPIVRV